MEFARTELEYEEYVSSMSLKYDPNDNSFEQDYWIKTIADTNRDRLNKIFKKEYDSYIKKQQYFYGCPFDIYLSTYPSRLQQFIIDGKDELYFIEYEFKQGIEHYQFSQFLNDDFKGKLETSLRQRKRFLIQRLKELGYSITIEDGKIISPRFKISELEEINEPKFDKYCEVGALFAQNLISRRIVNEVTLYFYKEHSFKSSNKLSTYIKNEVLHTEASINQYINDTLYKNDTRKNFFLHLDMMEQIFEYCKYYNIQISHDFQLKFNDLKKLH